MTVEIRRAEPTDLPALILADARAFNTHLGPAGEQDGAVDLDLDRFFLAVDETGTIVGNTGTFAFDVTLPGGAVLPMGGVTWVFVDSLHRRRGILRSLMARQHQELVEEGRPLAMLQASEAAIYGRFGYGEVAVERRIEVDRKQVAFRCDLPGPSGVRYVETAELRELAPDIHHRWCAVTPAAVSRSDTWWDRIARDRPEHRGGMSALFHLVHADGYASYRIRHGSAVTLTAEVFAATDEAHAALWRALLSKDLVDVVASSSCPADDPLPFLLTDQRLVRTTASEDAMWGRILDVPAVLAARRYATEIEVVIDVVDLFLDRGGRFRLEGGPDGATCERTDSVADIALDVADLSSLVFGAHRAGTLARAGRIGAADPAVLRRVDVAFGVERDPRGGTHF